MDISAFTTLSKSARAQILKEARKLNKAHQIATNPGHVERKLNMPMDIVGAITELSDKELLEQKAFEYEELLTSNKQVAKIVEGLETGAISTVKPLTKSQLDYRRGAENRAKKAEALRTLARETLAHLNREPDPLTGKAPKLTPFEREVCKELRDMQLIGIEVPFNFPGKKQTELLQFKDSLEHSHLEAKFSAMSVEEISRYARAAQTILASINQNQTGELTK